MTRMSSHGGGCCGISHISDMNTYDGGSNFRNFERANRMIPKRLYEVVVTSSQLNDPFLRDYLERNGFKLKTKFNNANSNNNCYVFHRTQERPFGTERGEKARWIRKMRENTIEKQDTLRRAEALLQEAV